MDIRILYIWISILLPIPFSYASEITSENISEDELTRTVKGKIQHSLVFYKDKIQSKTSPRCKTFAEAYHYTLAAHKLAMESAYALLKSIPITNLDPEVKSSFEDLKKDYETSPPLYVESNQLWELLSSTPTIKFGFQTKPQKIAKVRRRFGVVKEVSQAFENTLNYVDIIFKRNFSGYSKETYAKTGQVFIALLEWRENSCKSEEHIMLNFFFKNEFIKSLLESIDKTGGVNLTLFVCVPVNYSSLTSETPEEYFLVSPEKSLLSKHILYLENLIEEFLVPTKVPVKLSIMIGDSDGKDYLWNLLENPMHLNEEELTKRRTRFALNIKSYVSTYLPSVQTEVHSLHQNEGKDADQELYKEIFFNYSKYFSDLDMANEIARMTQLWKNENYYNGLPYPTGKDLEIFIAAKCAAYAVHGVIADKLNPYSILCQTEFPSELRTKMINMGRKEFYKNGAFSVIYLLEIKEENKNIKIFETENQGLEKEFSQEDSNHN